MSDVKHPARRGFLRTSTAIALGGVISLLIASGATKANPHGSSVSANAHFLPASNKQATGNREDLSKLPDGELKSYLADTDVLRIPFDSTIATIKICLRQPETKIESCLEDGSNNRACETNVPQCATAAEQAWQVYIAHYLRLLRTKAPTISSADSQRAWEAYVDAECSFESSIYPDDAVMRDTVSATCRAIKAQERALELRGSLIDADS
ncbi:MAG TPA: lysozyme inhibitor LprI family protein [Sphingomonas sp.]